MFKFLFPGVIALGLQLAVLPARADLFAKTLPGADVATMLQQTLGTTAVHLHNLGALTNGSYYLAMASSIKVPESVSGVPGQRTYFSLPDESRTVLGLRYGYYINQVRSNGVFVAANPDSFTISILLTSDGPALIGTCVRVRSGKPCDPTGTASLPSIEWRDARIDIVAKPIVSARSIALDVQSVAIAGDFDVGMACEWPLIGRRLCAAVNRQAQRLKAKVETQVKDALNTAEVRRAVAAGVRQYLDTVLDEPALGVRRVSMQDGQVTIGVDFGR